MIINRALLAACLPATCSEESRFSGALDCLHVDPSGRVTATDGHILVSAQQDAPFPDTDFPAVPGAGYHGGPISPVLLPAELAGRLIKATPKKSRIPILSCVQVSRNGSEHSATITATDLEIPTIANVRAVTHPDGITFPAFDRILAAPHIQAGEFITVCLALDVLETMLKSAKAVTAGNRQPTVQIRVSTRRVDLTADDASAATSGVAFTVNGNDGITVSGVAMPCRR